MSKYKLQNIKPTYKTKLKKKFAKPFKVTL